MEENLSKLKQLEDIKKEDLKESWSWDYSKMECEVRELQRKIRLAKKERGKQPMLVVQSPLTRQFYKVYQYQILNYEKSQICAEVKVGMTDEEVEEFRKGYFNET